MNGLKTYSGLFILAIPTIAKIFGYDISQGESTEIVNAVIALGGSILTVVGVVHKVYKNMVK